MAQALLLVDLQNDYFSGGAMELVGADLAVGHARDLLERFRDLGSPVVHVRHRSTRPGATFFLPGTRGIEIHPAVAPAAGETVVEKQFPNGFRDTGLLEHLRGAGVERLLVCGAMSHMCIDATVRAASDLGFRCTLADDACATRDLRHRGETVPAAQVHAAFMAALSGVYAQVVSAREALAAAAAR
ncbi:MAG: cysteine hydrolase family protein [Deferrisomatales bacterium]